jgi:hypothetical protein
MPDFTPLRTFAIQIDGAGVGLRMTETHDLRYPASGKFPIYCVRKYILKVLPTVFGCRPNALIFIWNSPGSDRWRSQTEGNKSCELGGLHDFNVP